MSGYILRRIAFAIPTLVVVSIGIFLMVRLLPGDIIDILFGGDQTASEEVKQQAREQLGLNGSYPEQYWRWISGVLQGDFGFSLRNTEPVSNIVFDALVVTLELVVLALLIATVDRRPARRALCRQARHRLGLRRARRRPRRAQRPSFWLATLLLLFTSRVFGWVPPLVYISPFDDPIGNLSQFILPAISISVFTMAIVMRMVRATMLEVLGQDYVRTARAKGVDRRTVISKHALRNALIPVVTIVGFEIGVLIGGAAIIETIFGLPGIGYVLLQAIFGRDYPVIQAMTLLIAFTFIFANLLVDILYGVLDPRISQE